MQIAYNQGVDGLAILKRLKTSSIFSGNRDLAEKIESAIKSANGYDIYLSELMKLHEPIRKNVNRILMESLDDIDETLKTPQFNMIYAQIKMDARN